MTLKNFILALLLCGGALDAAAQSPELLYQQANGLYQAGKIAEARDLYESIASNGYESGDLLYNLGNAHYRLGDLGRAILNFERARRIMPADDDLRHNLQLANLRVVDRIEPTPRLFLWDWWDGIKGAFSAQSALWFSFALFVLLASALMTMMLIRAYVVRKSALIAGVVTALLLAFSLVLTFQKIADDGRRDEAVVVASITTIKNSPDGHSTDAFVLHAGVKVRVIDSVNDWIQIRLADGKVGWMERGAAETI
jgi:tetratricopeptide (TPR) repeat protein